MKYIIVIITIFSLYSCTSNNEIAQQKPQPGLFSKDASSVTKTGVPTGPFANGATNPPIDPEVASTLPMVKSTSLTTIPGDAKFNAIPYSPNLRFI